MINLRAMVNLLRGLRRLQSRMNFNLKSSYFLKLVLSINWLLKPVETLSLIIRFRVRKGIVLLLVYFKEIPFLVHLALSFPEIPQWPGIYRRATNLPK